MSTNQLFYVCSECGEEYTKWQGKCSNCGAWNSLKEFKNPLNERRGRTNANATEITNLAEIKTTNYSRKKIGIFEVDRVLGGGLVPGSVILLAGEPGIGKSTLVMQLADNVKKTLYVSGEESLEQIKMRAERLKVSSYEINLIAETNVENILATITKISSKPELIIIDSIQTMYSENFPSTAGSIVQVRECALSLSQFAKKENIPIILIGHVTKEGTVAGPKTLEHMVDVVLNLEGERFGNLRILRAQKNRFGDTQEIGIFEIGEKGMMEVKNPSKLFLDEYHQTSAGSAITAIIEGSRPLLIEIQALTTPTIFGYPRRTAAGFDMNRLQLIIAILINRGNLNLGSQDVYVNISGGFKVGEPAADLAVAAAIISAYKKKPIKEKTIIFGELTLGGQIRKVPFEDKRMQEAKRLGFTNSLSAKEINQAIKEISNV